MAVRESLAINFHRTVNDIGRALLLGLEGARHRSFRQFLMNEKSGDDTFAFCLRAELRSRVTFPAGRFVRTRRLCERSEQNADLVLRYVLLEKCIGPFMFLSAT
jgi:hypothetical protein